jgi:hypothetical protein
MEKRITHRGFIDAFEKALKTNRTQREAYEETEAIYQRENAGERRYSDFQSFRNQWYKRLKSKK